MIRIQNYLVDLVTWWPITIKAKTNFIRQKRSRKRRAQFPLCAYGNTQNLLWSELNNNLAEMATRWPATIWFVKKHGHQQVWPIMKTNNLKSFSSETSDQNSK